MDFEFEPELTMKEKSAKKASARLPSTLLKRLAKRGLIEKDQAKKLIENAEKSERASKEEIIAEDYDDVEEEPNQYDFEYVKKPEENLWKERMKKRISEGGNAGYKSCPNKYNIFHKCTLYCVNKWGDGIPEPSDEYLKRRIRLLLRHPIPSGWKEVYDNGCGAYYYWNQQDNTVSWLPPTHPKAHISKSAGVLRKELEESISIDDIDTVPGIESGYEPTVILSPSINPIQQQEPIKIQPIQKKNKSRDLDKALRTKNERRLRREESDKLDPMDPASYSDIPRGTWSSGLNNEERNSGVDSTVTGTLYQMRPYPSPGTVLKNNLKKTDNNDEGGDSDNTDDDI